MTTKTKVMLSPITGKMTTYYQHFALATYQVAAPVPPESLRTLINSELLNASYDAHASDIKIIQTSLHTNVQSELWIAEEPQMGLLIGPWAALAILAICVAAVSTIYIIASTAQSIIERFWPQNKFYQYDAEGNAITVNTLAEYITCQRATHPDQFVCNYCGQVFATVEERDAHQETCPWREGVPNGEGWPGLLILALGAGVIITAIWGLTKIFGREKGTPIIITK